MSFHPAILTPTQRSVLQHLSPIVTQSGFYLAGGTAVALHLGHRRSQDLDWFTTEPIADPLQLAAMLRAQGISFVTDRVAPGTLYGTVRRVRISFIEDIAHLLYALAYFRDADRERTPRLLWRVDWRDVKRLLIEEVKRVPLATGD